MLNIGTGAYFASSHWSRIYRWCE